MLRGTGLGFVASLTSFLIGEGRTARAQPLSGPVPVAGLGCDPSLEPPAKNTGGYIPDDFQHEIATSYVVKDRGLMVLISCSHRGVLNTVKQAQAATGIDRCMPLSEVSTWCPR